MNKNTSEALKVVGENRKAPTLTEINTKKIVDEAQNKLNELVRDYFRDSKDDSFGHEEYFKKYNNQWQLYVQIKNKQQRYIVLGAISFEKRVKFMLELAEKQQKEEYAPKTES